MNQTQKIIKPKLGLLELARQLGNVQSACQVMGKRKGRAVLTVIQR